MVVTRHNTSVVHGKRCKMLMGTHQRPGSAEGNALRPLCPLAWASGVSPLSGLRMALLKSPELSPFHAMFHTLA